MSELIRPRIRPVRLGGRLLLKIFGFWAAVTPWRTIYILPERRGLAWLIRHEVAHLAQMDRDGVWRFWVQCLGWVVWPGYHASPYEIEARACAVDPRHPLLAGYDLAQ